MAICNGRRFLNICHVLCHCYCIVISVFRAFHSFFVNVGILDSSYHEPRHTSHFFSCHDRFVTFGSCVGNDPIYAVCTNLAQHMREQGTTPPKKECKVTSLGNKALIADLEVKPSRTHLYPAGRRQPCLCDSPRFGLKDSFYHVGPLKRSGSVHTLNETCCLRGHPTGWIQRSGVHIHGIQA